jgi:hypothetical protein
VTGGLSAGRAILRGAQERAELDRSRGSAQDPPVGAPRDGVAAGRWGVMGDNGEPKPDEMPPGCPVKVLGYNGSDLLLVDAAGQLRTVSEKFSIDTVTRLFGDRIGYVYWAWPRFGRAKKGQPPPVDTFRAERVHQSFWGEAYRCGLFDKLDMVRGRGVWPGPGGGLIVHCGDYLYINGRMAHVGEVDGAIYPRLPAMLHPYHEPVGPEPALEIMDAFSTCSWSRPKIDPLLMLGWIGSALMSGTLHKRPTIFLTGDKGWGKTWLQEYIKLIFGPYLLSANDVTPAGIYQRVGHDARPVAIDELEAGDDPEKVLRVTKLARLGYDGAIMLRGGSDHNPVEFKSRSSFLMSAINPPPVPPAELSRLGLLSLKRPPLDRKRVERVFREEDVLGARIFKRLIDGWPGFERLLVQYKEALHAGGHEQRGQETYGTLLACAHVMLGDDGMDALGYPLQDRFGQWAEDLAAQSLPEYLDARENWLGALSILLGKSVDQWRGGSQLSVGAVIEAVEAQDIDLKKANRQLAAISLKLLGKGERPGSKGMVLCVPNSAPELARIFQGSDWGAGSSGYGVWTSALRQSPAGVLMSDVDNRVTINRVTSRCSMIDLGVYDEITRVPGLTPAAAAPDGEFGSGRF